MDGEFRSFAKVPRLSRNCIITEKIDGTNAQVFIWDEQAIDPETGQPVGPCPADIPLVYHKDNISIAAASRTRYLTVSTDNYKFARWVSDHAAELAALGHGRHYGEWWGQGIQRKYGLQEKRFSLFNVTRWCKATDTPQIISTDHLGNIKYQERLPSCCHLVPLIYTGLFTTEVVDKMLHLLAEHGSLAVPGYMNPEGIVIYHEAARQLFKKTIADDEKPKGCD